jgi:chemotaxis signal transduction protein
MTLIPETELQSFVLLRLGERRFALAATQISELVAPSRVFRFPHNTSEIEGVIVRRGRIVPVCDVAEKLIGKGLKSRRFYLIAQRRYGKQTEWVALPVTGDCELISAEMTLPSDTDAAHVSGWISHSGDVIEVLNLSALTPGPGNTSITSTVEPAASSVLEARL